MSLKEIRESRALTQDELARACGLSRSLIIRLEANSTAARPSTIQKLSQGLALSIQNIKEALAEKGE